MHHTASLKQKTTDLGTGSVGKLLFRLAVPTITAQVINVLYITSSTASTSATSRASAATPLTGVGVTLPLITAVFGLRRAHELRRRAPRPPSPWGRTTNKTAERIMGNCLVLLVAAAAVLTALVLAFSEPLLYFFGASSANIGYANEYLRIYALGTLFVQLSLGMKRLHHHPGLQHLRHAHRRHRRGVQHRPRPGLHVRVWPGRGRRGLGHHPLAVYLQRVRAVVSALQAHHPQAAPAQPAPQPQDHGRQHRPGAFALYHAVHTESVLFICFNRSLRTYGGDLAVGAMTILSSVMQFSMLPLQGLNAGQPAPGQLQLRRGQDRPASKRPSGCCSFPAWPIPRRCGRSRCSPPQVLAGMFTNNAELLEYHLLGASHLHGHVAHLRRADRLPANLRGTRQRPHLALSGAFCARCSCSFPLIFILPQFFARQCRQGHGRVPRRARGRYHCRVHHLHGVLFFTYRKLEQKAAKVL